MDKSVFSLLSNLLPRQETPQGETCGMVEPQNVSILLKVTQMCSQGRRGNLCTNQKMSIPFLLKQAQPSWFIPETHETLKLPHAVLDQLTNNPSKKLLPSYSLCPPCLPASFLSNQLHASLRSTSHELSDAVDQKCMFLISVVGIVDALLYQAFLFRKILPLHVMCYCFLPLLTKTL